MCVCVFYGALSVFLGSLVFLRFVGFLFWFDFFWVVAE